MVDGTQARRNPRHSSPSDAHSYSLVWRAAIVTHEGNQGMRSGGVRGAPGMGVAPAAAPP